MTNTPETIYLIPGEDIDGSPAMVWCDDPAPDEHCDPEEAVKYVRADVAELEVSASEKCDAPVGWIPPEKYNSACESKMEFFKTIQELRARVAELEACLSIATEILSDQGAVGSIMARFRKILRDEAEKAGGE